MVTLNAILTFGSVCLLAVDLHIFLKTITGPANDEDPTQPARNVGPTSG